MKSIPSFIFLFALIPILFGTAVCGQQVDNTKPMYGEVPKNEEYKKLDQNFIQLSLKQFGTIDSAVNVQIDLAWRYFYNNNLGTAMKRFNQAWLLSPEFPDSYFGFAALMDMQSKSEEAARFYQLAIAKDKTKSRSEICYQRIADCKEQLKDYDGTIAAYSRITEINPANSFAFKKLGYFFMNAKSTEKALKAYNKAIELDPTDAMTYSNRAHLYQITRDYSKAISDYSKAIQLEPTSINALVNRGIIQMETKNFMSAKKDFETCVQLDDNSPELRRFLGLSKLKINDLNGACKDFQAAKKLGDNQADQLIRENCK